jgi:hypothetical protein
MPTKTMRTPQMPTTTTTDAAAAPMSAPRLPRVS